MGPHDGVAEVLAALLKGVQGQNPDARQVTLCAMSSTPAKLTATEFLKAKA
jgi:hypothetical protein